MTTAAPAAVHVVDRADGAAAMLHPLRLRLLRELGAPDSAAGLSRRVGVARQLVNYHLRQLEAEGLVEEVGTRQQRGCTERLLQAVAEAFVISPSTIGLLAARPEQVRDQASSAYLLAVAGQAIEEVGDLRRRADRAGKRVPTLTVQTEVRFASAESQQAFGEELAREVARLVARYHDAGASGGRRFRVVAGAWPAPPLPAVPASSRTEDIT
jgi:DNA-binding transcriptional ArsR family regulator